MQTKEQQFLTVFQKVTKLISMVLDHQEVMDTIVNSLPELLEIDACTIRLIDNTTNTFVLGASHGLSVEYLSRQVIDTGETMEHIKTGQPVARVEAEDGSCLLGDAPAREGIKSILTVPILFQDSIIGILRLLTRSRRVFSGDEISFTMALAEQVGISISNGRLFKEMENQVDFLREVQEISKLVNATLDLDAIFQMMVERLATSLGAKGCTLRLLNPQTNHLELVASHGVSEAYAHRGTVGSEKNIVKVLAGRPVSIYDVRHDDRVAYQAEMEEEGIRSLLAVPVQVGADTIGVMRILSGERRVFTSSEINFAVTLAEVGGHAITNGRNFKKINLLFHQIEEHERFLSDILDCLKLQLIVLDRHRHIVLANKAFLLAVNLTEHQALGMEYQRFCSPEDEGASCPVDTVFSDAQPAVYVHEVQMGDKVLWMERTAAPMFGEKGQVEYVIEIIRDVTAELELEKEKVQSGKLQGVVELAGTVAHEINSPLFAAIGMAQLMEDEITDQELQDDLQMILRNLKSISALTKKMTNMTGYTSREYVGNTNIVEL